MPETQEAPWRRKRKERRPGVGVPAGARALELAPSPPVSSNPPQWPRRPTSQKHTMGGGHEVQRWEAMEEQRRREVWAPLEGVVGEIGAFFKKATVF